MKKSIFFMAGCAVALASCTQTDVIEEGVQSSAIGFENAVNKESRAFTSVNDLTKFFVYGYYTKADATNNPVNVFDGETVTLADGAWGYTNTRYWVPDATYRFYAYSCENGTSTCEAGLDLTGTTTQQRALSLTGYTLHDHHDLIFATNDNGIIGKETGNAKVAFTFKHILSKINVVFDSEFAPGYDVVISNVRFENIYDKGNYDPYDEWTSESRTSTNENNPTKVELALVSGKDVASAADANVEGSVELKAETVSGYVIPHEYGESLVRLVFDIDVKQGDDTMFSRTLTGSWKPNWGLGKAYTYNVTISGTAADLEPIVFETSQSIDGWGEGDTSEVKMDFSAN